MTYPNKKNDKRKLKKANELLEYVSNTSIDELGPLFDDIMETIHEYIQNNDKLNMSDKNNKEEMVDILDDIANEIAGWLVGDWDDYEYYDTYEYLENWNGWDERRYHDFEKDDDENYEDYY